jgi:transposase
LPLKKGSSLSEISHELSVSYGAVKKIWAIYQKEGVDGLRPHYDRCGVVVRSAESQGIYTEALRLRKCHETWGADRIRVEMLAQYGNDAPSVRTLQRWYRERRYSEPKMRHNEPAIGKSRAVHNIWQVDAKEQLVLLDGQVACYLTFTDEYSGGWLGSIAFAYHRINQVPLAEVREACITMFKRWGKAGSLRVDNGQPLGNPKRNATPALALWLIALDVDMIWNKPFSPTENAKVERMQGTSARWVEIDKCTDLQDLQARLDSESLVHREQLVIRRLQNQTRLQAFPELETSRRIFDERTFDVQRVYTFLAQKIYARQVSSSGVLTFFGHKFNIGLKNKGIKVEIKLNVADLTWLFYDNQTLLDTKPAHHLSEHNIRNLTVFLPVTSNINSSE